MKNNRLATIRLGGGALLLTLLGYGAQAEIYSWVDANGVMYFSDRPQSAVSDSRQPSAESSQPDKPATATARSRKQAVAAESKPVSIDIDMQHSVQFYPVHGQTAWDVHHYIEQFCPTDESGGRAAGKGIYAFNWRVTPRTADNRCAVGQVEVGVSVRQVLPKWSELADAEFHWQLWWQSYLDEMSRYEQRQQDLVQQGAEQIASRLKQLKSTSDCRTLQARVAQEGQHELNQLRRRSARLAAVGVNPANTSE